MSGSFNDIPKVEESFIQLSQIKDKSIWKALSSLLDSSLTLVQAQLTFDYLLKQLGDSHPQYEFMKILAIRCSYLLFGKDHVKEMIKEIVGIAPAGKENIIISSMNLLVVFARFFPSLFDGAVKDMLQLLLKDDNDHIKEGMVHILAKTGCPIHGKMIETDGPVDLLLKNLCLEGTRKQAKYAVQAIVAIKRDFGLQALSAVYKRLVDTLESDEHLATVLQSLGCIAQTAMPIFEAQEDDIIKFICRKLLRKNSIPTDISEGGCDDRSKECFLKICGIKTLVRSYLPYRDAHLRQRIKALFGVLTQLITTGEISEEVRSSVVDKSHMRLAAAKAILRLSRQWDCHINPQLFHLTLQTAQDIYPHVRKQFLAKVHRYLKDRNLHQKYACAFVLSTARGTEHDLLEARQYLAEFFETCQDTQLHQSSLQLDCNSSKGSPESVLSYLIHTLAHHPDFSVSNKSVCAEAFEPFYRQLYFFLSVILHQDQDKTHDPQKRNKRDNTPLIMTVFKTIMQMEDAVDKSKSENLYALCDLGLFITKEFAQSQVHTGSETISISLPGLYCRTSEGSEDAHLKGNPDEKLSNRSPYENGPKDGESLESEKLLGQNEEQSKGRTIEAVPNEVMPAADNVLITVAEALVLPKRKQGRPYENGPKDGESLEFERPSEQHEEQSKSRSEAVPHEVKSAADNMIMTIAEASVLPRRKRGRPCKDGPKDGESLGFKNPSKQHKKKSKSRIREVIPSEFKPAVDNDMMIVAEVSVLPKRKRGRPSKNGPKDGKLLELKKPSEMCEEQLQSTIEAVLNEVKPAANNIMTTVAEASVLPKRKRGRPRKWSVDLASQSNIQNLSGKYSNQSKVSQPKRGCKECVGCKSESITSGLSRETWMWHNDQLIQRSKSPTQKQLMCLRKLDIKSTCKVEQKRKRKTSDAVPRKTTVAEVNCTYTDVETLGSSKRKKRCLHKESPDFPSPGQLQGLLERSKGLKFSHCRGGRPKGSGKILDSKEKLKLPDSTIMAIERVSDGFSGAELTPNCQPLEENNVSGQNVAKISNKRLDDNHDKLEKTIEKNPLGDQKFSTENESLDPKSEIVCLHKKKPTSPPESPEKGLNEDGNNHKGSPRKTLRRKGLSGVDKSASQKLKKKIGEELVGHGIKVWWPQDKKFYAGVVESYDPKYRKHKVIYHDGDVEVLRLWREQWELINGDPMSTKR